MAKVGQIEVRNKTNSMLVVGNKILSPKGQVFTKIDIYNESHIKSALFAERNRLIDIKKPIDKKVVATFPKLFETEKEEVVEAVEEIVEEKVEEVTEKVTEEVIVEKAIPYLRYEVIDEMTVKEMKSFIAEWDLNIEGYSKKNSAELKAALKEYYREGNETSTEE